ncbi:MAG: pyrophosphohydrolase [Candidatus Bipolaricaulota bacterium]|nr:pyrophosphohydrolase [Candidatus Bipolaricaulota bacterium]
MPLPLRGTLADFQRYVAELERERGFDDQTARDKCLLLGEEVGELFRAVRRAEGLKVDPTSRPAEVADELADCLIYLLAIANRYDVDLEAAFRAKEARNRERAWTSPKASGLSA